MALAWPIVAGKCYARLCPMCARDREETGFEVSMKHSC